ncbi:MAG TPA: SpoIIE family protein phosphatase [Coriobacteriia bacterium]|nr:SpoIIE family protein phosphatase [Coriobacteriia bacterium]
MVESTNRGFAQDGDDQAPDFEPRNSGDRPIAESLSERIRLLHTIIENSQAAVYAKDPQGRFILNNQTSARLLGATPEEIYGKRDDDLLPPEFAKVIREHDREVMRTRAREEYQEVIGISGVVPHTYVSAKFPLIDAYGNVVGVGGVSTDISQWKAAERAANEAYRRLDALDRVTDLAIETLELDDMLSKLLPEIAAVFDADIAVVLLLDGDRLTVRAAHGLEAERRTGLGVAIGEGFAGTIGATKKSYYLHDVFDSSLVRSTWVFDTGIRTMLGVPLLRGDALIGVLHVDWREPRDYDPRQEQLLDLLGDRVSLAVANATLYESQRDATRLAETLNSVNELLLSVVDFDELMSDLVVRAARAVNADKSSIVRPDKDEWVVQATHNFASDVKGTRYSRPVAQSLELARKTRAPVFVEDASAGSAESAEAAHELGLGSYMLLPLAVKDDFIGVLNLGFSEPQRFTEWSREAAGRLATAVSLAIDRARLYEAEHRVASILQESLLAMPESVEGIGFGCVYSSATQAARVGGDFFDLFEIEGDRVGVLIGDVSGKGLDAAVLTSLVKNTVHAYASDGRHGPASVVARTNNVVERSTTSEIFVTLFFAVLSPDRRQMTYCNAGHTTGMLRRTDGTVERLTPTAPLVGAFSNFTFADKSLVLDAGDLVVLYTDGVIEARRGRELFGEDRVAGSVADSDGPPQSVVTRLAEIVTEFAEGGLTDDVAILALRVEPGLDNEEALGCGTPAAP